MGAEDSSFGDGGSGCTGEKLLMDMDMNKIDRCLIIFKLNDKAPTTTTQSQNQSQLCEFP